MNLFSLSDLYDLCLKYSDVESVFSLKHTCKELYHRIPKYWCMDRVIFNENQIYQRDYRFLTQLYCFQSRIQVIELKYKSFRSIREISLIQVNKLTRIYFDPKINMIDHIFINHAKSLDELEIPKEYTRIKMLYIAYANISSLVIHNTWKSLKTLVLIGLVQLNELVIPRECEKIEFINISKSCIETIYIYPKFRHNVVIQTTGVFIRPINVYTHLSNDIQIIKTGSLFLKPLPIK